MVKIHNTGVRKKRKNDSVIYFYLIVKIIVEIDDEKN